jgi:hypothetical protein
VLWGRDTSVFQRHLRMLLVFVLGLFSGVCTSRPPVDCLLHSTLFYPGKAPATRPERALARSARNSAQRSPIGAKIMGRLTRRGFLRQPGPYLSAYGFERLKPHVQWLSPRALSGHGSKCPDCRALRAADTALLRVGRPLQSVGRGRLSREAKASASACLTRWRSQNAASISSRVSVPCSLRRNKSSASWLWAT